MGRGQRRLIFLARGRKNETMQSEIGDLVEHRVVAVNAETNPSSNRLRTRLKAIMRRNGTATSIMLTRTSE